MLHREIYAGSSLTGRRENVDIAVFAKRTGVPAGSMLCTRLAFA
jgi:hypothetical protein